jgi:hypothetical protein
MFGSPGKGHANTAVGLDWQGAFCTAGQIWQRVWHCKCVESCLLLIGVTGLGGVRERELLGSVYDCINCFLKP